MMSFQPGISVKYINALGHKIRGIVLRTDSNGTVYVKLPIPKGSSKKSTGVVWFESHELDRLKVTTIHQCGSCGYPGHNRRTCTKSR